MPVLGDVKFNQDASCREAELIRWKKNVQGNINANRNTGKESQVVFPCDWLGASGERILESHNCSEADKNRYNI